MADEETRSDGAITTRTAASAVALKIAGASYEEVALTLGLPSAAHARKLVEKDLAARAEDAAPEQRQMLRAEASARLERLMRAMWTKATTPADPEFVPASRQALALVDRYIRLHGLDAPAEVMIHTPAQAELDAWVAQMLGLTGQGIPEVEEADVIVIEGEVMRDGEGTGEPAA